MYGIVYKITCLINNKIYIGKTTRSIQERFREHLYSADSDRSYISYLYNAINKYGSQNFIIEEIEQCTSEAQLNEREIHWISTLHSQDSSIGYNIQNGGEGGNIRSKEWQPSAKQLAALEYGRHLPASEKQKQQLSKRRKNIVVTNETREKLRKASTGRIMTSQTRKKLSDSHKGLKMPERSESQRARYAASSSNRIHIHKGNQNKNPKREDLQKYLSDGWQLGYHFKNDGQV